MPQRTNATMNSFYW